MHYHAEVWVSKPRALFGSSFKESTDRAVEIAMAPHQENEDGDGWWDWYQIGGRYTGRHDPSYDPSGDPANIEKCPTCNGTGFRTDKGGKEERVKDPTYTCNACGDFILDENKKIVGWKHGPAGAGKRAKWPTSWVPFAGDVMEVRDIPELLSCYTLVVKGQVEQERVWNGEDFVATDFDGLVVPKLKELGITDGYLVTVDYHS